MIRAWIALAMLGGSWLWGLDYYRPANFTMWSVAVGLGVLLLSGAPLRLPRRREGALALALLLPVAWWMPWPYCAVPVLIAIGLGLHLVPIPGRWPGRIGRGAVAAGVILLVQALALWLYAALTGRSHDLPWPLPSLVGVALSLLGVDVAVDGSTLAMATFRETHRLIATWDLLLDPATLALFAGGLTWLGWAATCNAPQSRRWTAWLRAARSLAMVLVAWLPLRVALLVGLLLHRAIRVDPAARLNVMDQFFSPWVYLAILAAPVLAAWRLVRLPKGDGWLAACATASQKQCSETAADTASAKQWHTAATREWLYPAALGLLFLGVAVFAFWFQWQPVGQRLGGRVMVVERHSTWSPSMPAYSTTRFGEDGSYNYAAVYDYCAQFFSMSRLLESDPIDDQKLSACDVLVIKVPTAAYAPAEIQAVVRFVDRGDGLLLIGDHTNYEKSGSILNCITGHFGFKYRDDLLFYTGDPYFQPYRPPAVPHPVVQHVPPMSFAVSCSINPGHSAGHAVIRGTGLWNLQPNYRFSNWHPEAEYGAGMRYGPFIQLWGTAYGKGRVLAWTDSTIFSSFCTFQPGKAELFRGMLDWLNHRSLFDRAWPRWILAVVVWLAALALVAAGLRWAWIARVSPLLLLAAALLGWTTGSAAAVVAHRVCLPPPEPNSPRLRVVIDRTVSDVPLSRGAYIEREDGRGYGLFEQWIARLGYFTERRSGAGAFDADVLVILCPRKSVPQDFREGLVEYVADGGKLLVIDSPDSAGSTANSLLWPFGMDVNHAGSREGTLGLAGGWPGVAVEAACEVQGGTPFAWVDGLPVAAGKDHGKGAVMAIGFGSALNDANLGLTFMADATPEVRTRSELLFALVRALATGRPVDAFAPKAPKGRTPAAKTK